MLSNSFFTDCDNIPYYPIAWLCFFNDQCMTINFQWQNFLSCAFGGLSGEFISFSDIIMQSGSVWFFFSMFCLSCFRHCLLSISSLDDLFRTRMETKLSVPPIFSGDRISRASQLTFLRMNHRILGKVIIMSSRYSSIWYFYSHFYIVECRINIDRWLLILKKSYVIAHVKQHTPRFQGY